MFRTMEHWGTVPYPTRTRATIENDRLYGAIAEIEATGHTQSDRPLPSGWLKSWHSWRISEMNCELELWVFWGLNLVLDVFAVELFWSAPHFSHPTSTQWIHLFVMGNNGSNNHSWMGIKMSDNDQWIGLREILQESPIFNGKIYGFL